MAKTFTPSLLGHKAKLLNLYLQDTEGRCVEYLLGHKAKPAITDNKES